MVVVAKTGRGVDRKKWEKIKQIQNKLPAKGMRRIRNNGHNGADASAKSSSRVFTLACKICTHLHFCIFLLLRKQDSGLIICVLCIFPFPLSCRHREGWLWGTCLFFYMLILSTCAAVAGVAPRLVATFKTVFFFVRARTLVECVLLFCVCVVHNCSCR